MHLNTSSTSTRAASLASLLLPLLLLTCAPSSVLAAPTPKDAKFFPDILDKPAASTGSQGDAAAGMMLNPSRIGVDRVDLGLNRKITVDPVQVFGRDTVVPVTKRQSAAAAAEESEDVIETETETEPETEEPEADADAALARKSLTGAQKQNDLPHPKYIPKRRGSKD